MVHHYRASHISRVRGTRAAGGIYMRPLASMWNRIDITRSNSESVLFYDLMFLGEMITKLIVVGLIAEVEDDRARQRYAIEHTLVRADSIGDWVKALDKLTKGPESMPMPDEANRSEERRVG